MDRQHQPRVRLRRSKRLRLASPAATTLSSSRLSSCSRGGDGNNWRGRMGERAGEMFSDLTRRAISISSSEGLSSPGGAGGGVVDLTNDSGVEDELVDLTSPVTGLDLNGRPNCGRERGRRRLRGDVVVLDDESDESAADEVQIMEPARPLPHSSKLAQRVAILFPLFGKYIY
ncbi:hypothetical protein GBAR_LOCUS2235 [Geodia barretti]|uniref:Uncharacterized protein n=1 Tax=Geodia barretti TaxID=519541 RepID=A0AA35W2L7_GEOBA|nr:hypothetical protein GBAR_LOCUS2235 [Geodia barretti]